MSEEILIQPSFDSLTEKLDNTATYEDWLIIQEYIDELRKENRKLKQTLNEIKDYIKNTTTMIIVGKPMKLSEETSGKDILQIIEKVLGSDK